MGPIMITAASPVFSPVIKDRGAVSYAWPAGGRVRGTVRQPRLATNASTSVNVPARLRPPQSWSTAASDNPSCLPSVGARDRVGDNGVAPIRAGESQSAWSRSPRSTPPAPAVTRFSFVAQRLLLAPCERRNSSEIMSAPSLTRGGPGGPVISTPVPLRTPAAHASGEAYSPSPATRNATAPRVERAAVHHARYDGVDGEPSPVACDSLDACRGADGLTP
jgi:hypothetical protein